MQILVVDSLNSQACLLSRKCYCSVTRRHQERMPQLCRSTKHHASCLTLSLYCLLPAACKQSWPKASTACLAHQQLCFAAVFLSSIAKQSAGIGFWSFIRSFISPCVEPQVGSLRARPCCVVPPRGRALVPRCRRLPPVALPFSFYSATL